MSILTRIVTFLKDHPSFKEVRVVTNSPTPGEKVAWETSETTKNVARDGSARVFALDTGNWMYRFLEKRAEAKGIKFRLNVVQNGCITLAENAPQSSFTHAWETAVEKSTFAWSTAANSFFLQIWKQDGNQAPWGLSELGVEVRHAPKTAKRNNELSRSAELSFYTEDMEDLKVAVIAPDDLSPAARDGMSYVSKSFAMRMAEEIGDPGRSMDVIDDILQGREKLLGTFRVLFGPGFIDSHPDGGMIKGHAIIVEDDLMGGHDMVTVPENIKDEIRATEKFIFATAELKHSIYQATWDSQRLVMNPQVLTHDHRRRDLNHLLETVKESISSGKIPEWLLLDSAEEFLTDGESIRDVFSDIDSVPLRWQAAGYDIRAAQNVVRMTMGSTINRMGKEFSGGVNKGVATGYAKRMWLPKSNAFVAYFISHGSLSKVGNLIARRSGKQAYMLKGIGLVLPDDRIEDLLALMGGADFDDSAEVNLIKVWSSNDKATAIMRDAGVIGRNDPIPNSQEEATYMACLLRSPNGIGEYAMVQIDRILDAPWQMLDLDNVEVVDLATLPTPSTILARRNPGAELQGSLVYSGEKFSSEDALAQIIAQQNNPSIGAAANALMAWVASGGKDLPPSLNVGFEQLVDGVQQLSDPALFEQVERIGSDISSNARNLLIATGGKVDSYIIPRFAKDDRETAVQHSYDGPMAEFQEAYRKAILELYTEVEMKSLQMRDEQPLVHVVRQLPFSRVATQTAMDFISKYNAKLVAVDRKYQTRNDAKALVKITVAKAKYAEMRGVIDEAVEELLGFGAQAPKRAVCVWKQILASTNRAPMGSYDRLIFQPGNDKSIMDLLIAGLKEYGL
jgi:hypothetical protein